MTRISQIRFFANLTPYRLFFGGIGFLTAALAFGAPGQAKQQEQQAPQTHRALGEGIAAIVNDEVISTYDVSQRANLILSSAGIEHTPEIDKRVKQQVVQTLIDEKLQLQEAKRYDIEITDDEIATAFDQLVKQNKITPQAMKESLAKSGVNIETLRTQIKAELAWSRLVNGLLSSRVSITGEEVDQFLNRLITSSTKPQYLVSEIFLEVPSQAQEQQIAQGAMQLIKQMQQGAPFNLVAQQFSANASAAQGGDIGWVQDGELAPELNQALRSLQPGQVSPPIRTLGGYAILALRDRRVLAGTDPMMATLELKQVLVPLAADASKEEVKKARKQADKVRAALDGCKNIDSAARKAENASVANLGRLTVAQLADRFQPAVATLGAGRASEPVRTEAGLHVLVVCSREDLAKNSQIPSRDQIQDRLYNQQLSMQARRYLRDLRRDSSIDVR